MVNEELYEDEIEDLADDESTDPALNHGTGFSREAFEAPDPHATESEWQDETSSDGYGDEHDQPQSTETHTSLDSLDQLPLALTLRCGSLELTLGDLRRIAAGTVLPVNGVTPGFATLCHGERVVAEGELVSVEGRLGLQITRMASHP
ncbi:FliM/FliN family flagellar motor switch protein [Pseudomonas petrae]|uniref:FliM/FliN family flagellar motor switch protein n=1 Tax=Pseudomonas petrae TaxID=2912190 RepID=UPI001F1F3AD0|nr:FliM/FliN family flagellar motor switch protein [Pseudomonas petrae]MCF7557990.1 FliM/FliN family flagellar motor switch protein [Pseudomonas petrae]